MIVRLTIIDVDTASGTCDTYNSANWQVHSFNEAVEWLASQMEPNTVRQFTNCIGPCSFVLKEPIECDPDVFLFYRLDFEGFSEAERANIRRKMIKGF